MFYYVFNKKINKYKRKQLLFYEGIKKTRASREGVRGKEFARKISGLAAA